MQPCIVSEPGVVRAGAALSWLMAIRYLETFEIFKIQNPILKILNSNLKIENSILNFQNLSVYKLKIPKL